MMKCLKCQKEYIPKRMGGLFCKPSHGNAYRQQLKRDEQKKAKLVEQGLAVKNPLTEGERGLWTILTTVMETGRALNDILLLPIGNDGRVDVGGKLARFVGDCERIADNSVVQEIRARLEAQQKAEERNKGKQ